LKKLGRSPDEMDALNLAYSEYTIIPPSPVPRPESARVLLDPSRLREGPQRRLFGR
jgi:hypothetical protein